MRKEKTRKRETANSLAILKALRMLLDQVGLVAERGVMTRTISPITLYLCQMSLHENEFAYREEIDRQIKILEEEQTFYGD